MYKIWGADQFDREMICAAKTQGDKTQHMEALKAINEGTTTAILD